MEFEHLKGKLPVEAKKAMRWQSIFTHSLWLLATAGYFLLVHFFDWWSIIGWISVGLLVVSFIIYTIIAPNVYMNVYSYEVTDTQIDVQRGLFIWYHTKIPLVKVQHVETLTGPIFRKFDLASVKIITAAGSVEIPALVQRDAEALREYIARLAEVDDEDE